MLSDERLREIASAIAADVLGNDHLRHKLDEQQSDEVHGDVQTIVMRHLKALSRRAAEQQEPVVERPVVIDAETFRVMVADNMIGGTDDFPVINADGLVGDILAALLHGGSNGR